jgi:hypothetical protein
VNFEMPTPSSAVSSRKRASPAKVRKPASIAVIGISSATISGSRSMV